MTGLADKYTWVDIGSSYLPSELQAAFLYSQLSQAQTITETRLTAWDYYDKKIRPLAGKWNIDIPQVPQHCRHNAHLYFIKLRNKHMRDDLISFARERGVQMTFHYVPLHSSPAGLKYGTFAGNDTHTTNHSERLLRLPLYMEITTEEQDHVINVIEEFLGGHP